MIAVLVTGVATPIGEQLVRSLMADTRVRHVLAVSHLPRAQALTLSPSPRLTYLQVDLTQTRRVRQLVFGPARDLGVEVVVHLAQHRSARSAGRKVHKLNVEALRSILDLTDRHPTIRRVVVRSHAEVYKVDPHLPVLVTENHPLNLSPRAAQFVRDRVEADLTACARMGLSRAEIVVLRCAEALAPGTGSQLFDLLQAPIALRPAGFDPMVNVATIADLVSAMERATHGSGEGVFNVPGYDTLPMSEAIRKWGTPQLPAPGPIIEPLYALRHRLLGSEFSYGMNRRRMHYGLVLDGSRANNELRYAPSHPIDWRVGGSIEASHTTTTVI
ncbi:MAG: NAD-dependent epimerase/dehydratase family protein [Myxococcota bacterium]